jgi:hypothetical protein
MNGLGGKMSEYEGKTHWRRRNQCTLADVFYYELTGKGLPPDIREELLKKEYPSDEDDQGEKCETLSPTHVKC